MTIGGVTIGGAADGGAADRMGVFFSDVFCCSIRPEIASLVEFVFEYAGELLCRNIKNLRQIKIDLSLFLI